MPRRSGEMTRSADVFDAITAPIFHDEICRCARYDMRARLALRDARYASADVALRHIQDFFRVIAFVSRRYASSKKYARRMPLTKRCCRPGKCVASLSSVAPMLMPRTFRR